MATPELGLVWQYVEKWANTHPEAEALVFADERLTWREFQEQVERIAKAYLELGIRKGDRIAFLGMARNEFLTTYMAAAKVGAIWLGLSPKYSVDEISFMLNDCQPRLLISIREYLGRDLVPVGADMVKQVASLEKALIIGEPVELTENFAEFVRRPRPHLDEMLDTRAAEINSDDAVLLMYTSGSTGRPKGVIHTHRSVLSNVVVEVERFGLHAGSRLLLHFPVNHVAADVEIGLAAVVAGGTTVSMERFDPEASLRTIERERITMVGQIPAMYLMQMQRPSFRETDFSAVEVFVWSGAAAPKVLIDTLMGISARTGARLCNAYGMTETAGLVTYSDAEHDSTLFLSSVGRVAEQFELRLVDEDRREVAEDEVGEIALRGPMLMQGYWNAADSTAEVMDEQGWFYTRDLARKDEQGNVHLVGRRSEMFKSGGENVYPREIEMVLESHPAVAGVAVVSFPDGVYGEVGRAFVLPKPGLTILPEELREFCRSRLANFKIPKRFEIRPQLPMLGNGKFDKLALKREAVGPEA